MAEEMLQIRSWRDYWNDFVIEGFKDHVSTQDIRKNILEAMRKEVFGQLMFRCKVGDIRDIQENDQNARIVESIGRNTLAKLRALIRHCKGFIETKDMLSEDDYSELMPFNEDEEDDGIEFTEQTAEWPELSQEDPYIDEGSQEWTKEELAAETREKNTHISEGEDSSN